MIKKKNIVSYIFYIIILLIEYRFFFIVNFPDTIQKMMTYHNKILLLLVTFMFFLFFGIYKRKVEFSIYVYIYIFLVILSAIYSYFTYSPKNNEILIPMAAYFLMILYFPLRSFFKENAMSALKILTYFNIIACILLLIQYVVYDINGTIFMRIYEFYRSGEVAIREGHIRITYLGTIISLSATISIGSLFIKGKNKTVHLINLLFSMIYFFYVSQTRMYVFSLLAVLMLQYNTIGKNTKSKILSSFTWILFTIVVFFALGLDNYVMAIISPILDGSYINDGSYYARLGALDYFISVISKNPLMGNGLLKPDLGSSYYSIIHSITGNATYSDVGILGVTAQFGIPMLLWYLFLLFKLYRTSKKTSNAVLNSLFLFILFSSLTLIVLDPQRIIFIVFTMVLFDIEQLNERKDVSNEFENFDSDGYV